MIQAPAGRAGKGDRTDRHGRRQQPRRGSAVRDGASPARGGHVVGRSSRRRRGGISSNSIKSLIVPPAAAAAGPRLVVESVRGQLLPPPARARHGAAARGGGGRAVRGQEGGGARPAGPADQVRVRLRLRLGAGYPPLQRWPPADRVYVCAYAGLNHTKHTQGRRRVGHRQGAGAAEAALQPLRRG